MNISKFSKVPKISNEKIFEFEKKYQESQNPKKINLGVGILLDEKGELVEHKSLVIAEKMIHESNLNKEYPPIIGLPEFKLGVRNLFFDESSDVVKDDRVLVCHMVSGGAALRVAGEVIYRFLPKKIHLSNETFGPYKNIFNKLEICYYPYYNRDEKRLDIPLMLEYLQKIEDGSVISFQLSSHNPTAMDPNKPEWDQICEVMKQKRHFALFDVAYLGYGSGSIEEDLYPIHNFSQNKVEMMITFCTGKSFTNCSDDVGALLFVLNKKEPLPKIQTHIVVLCRSIFSFVSLYGSRLIEKILMTPELKSLWIEEQKTVFNRIVKLRNLVMQEIEKRNCTHLNYLKKQTGLYIYLDFTDKQINHLIEKYSIFLSIGGRVNISGLREENIEYFVNSIIETIDNK